MAGWWNDHAYKLLPAGFITKLEGSFEPGAAHLAAIEIQYEICAGIGFGLALLLVVSCLCARYCCRSRLDQRPSDLHLTLIRWSPFVSLLTFMLAVDVSGPARIITPYYCLLMPLLLSGKCHENLVRRKWWRAAAVLTLLIAACLLILNPPRPLWPARSILNRMSSRYTSSLITRAAMLYDANAERWDALAPIRDKLPGDVKNIGFINFLQGSTMETSLWRPFGQRRIYWLRRSVDQPGLEEKGIKYVVIGTDPSTQKNAASFQEWMKNWLQANNARIIAQENVTILATSAPTPWYLIEVAPHR
jgi:hypothetical protein